MHLNPVHQSVKSASDIFALRQHALNALFTRIAIDGRKLQARYGT